jgi:D-alanyl-D-alanine carboxypeptidase
MAGPVAAGAQEFEAKLASFVKDNRLPGAAASVVHGSEIAWAAGAGFADVVERRPVVPSTPYRIASITKTFTATAVVQLRDAGKLDLDDPAVAWIPELADSGSPKTIRAVTIRRLLSHESGLKSEPPGTDWRAPNPIFEGSVERSLERVAEIFTALEPNRQFKYSNLGYQLLGEIVHRASGTAYPTYLQEQILDPLGLSSTAFEPLDDALAERCAVGYNPRVFSDEFEPAAVMPPLWAEGGLWSTVEDLGRWLSCQAGAYASPPAESPVLAASSLREMHKARYLADDTWTEAVGICWFSVRKDDVVWVQHTGGLRGFNSVACFDPERRVGAVVLINRAGPAAQLGMELGEIARRLVAAAPPVIESPAPMPERYRSLLGMYASIDMGDPVRVEWRDGKLIFVDAVVPDWQVELKPGDDADTFTVGRGFRPSGEPVRFGRLPDGRVASMSMAGGTLHRLDPVDPATGSGEATGHKAAASVSAG